MRPFFRSWAEDYVAQPEPINPDLVRAAMRKRGLAQRKARMSAARSVRNGAGRQDVTGARAILAEQAAAQARAADPIEQARSYLQRRGYKVFRASVIGGPPGHWKVGSRSGWLTDIEVVALAKRNGFTAGPR